MLFFVKLLINHIISVYHQSKCISGLPSTQPHSIIANYYMASSVSGQDESNPVL